MSDGKQHNACVNELKLAYASHAEAAARPAHWRGYVTSPDTLIQRQRAEPILKRARSRFS